MELDEIAGNTCILTTMSLGPQALHRQLSLVAGALAGSLPYVNGVEIAGSTCNATKMSPSSPVPAANNNIGVLRRAWKASAQCKLMSHQIARYEPLGHSMAWAD